ncbi:MAG: hypothetical protein R2719_04585 [Micropruina sp.]
MLSDYVAVAYSRTTGDVNAQVPVSSGGKYKLEVRPGSYFVQLAYVGSGNYTTQWVAAKGTAYMRAEATAVTAKLGNTPLNVATVTVGQGGVLTGKVVGTNGKALRDVFVSARTAWTSTREVVAQFSTDSGGNFTLRGLPPNKERLRINGSQIRRGAANISPAETGSGLRQVPGGQDADPAELTGAHVDRVGRGSAPTHGRRLRTRHTGDR